MELKHFKMAEVIFREGDPSNCMFRIENGKVGVFLGYGENRQTKLTELLPGQFLGEMGLLDKAPRSATAVSLCDDTRLRVIDEENFNRIFAENPDDMLFLLQQMSMRLRRISRDYADACRTVSDVVAAKADGTPPDAALQNRIAKTLAGYEASRLEEMEEGEADE